MIGILQKKVIRKINPAILASIKPIALTIVSLVIIGDILIFATGSDIITFPVLLLYIACVIQFKLKSKITFIFALSILLIMYLEYLFSGPSLKAEKAAVWLFLFFGIGVVQQWTELKK